MRIKRIDVKELKLVNKNTDIDFFDIRTTPMSMKVKNIIEEVAEEMIVIPSLQRNNNAWDKKKKSLFIDSVLRNFPIPPVMTMNISGKTIVLDGQQRINALINFKSNELKLNLGENNKWHGMKYKNLSEELQWRFNEFVLQIQRVEQISPTNEEGSISFEIFNRINSKSTPLTKMQVRYAAFYSEFTIFLKEKSEELIDDEIWGGKTPDIVAEKLLRFMAFYLVFKYEHRDNSSSLTKQTDKGLDFNETIDRFLTKAMVKTGWFKDLTEDTIQFVEDVSQKIGVKNFYSKNPSGGTTIKIQSTILDALAYGAAKDFVINYDILSNLSNRTDEIIKNNGYDFYKNYFQQTTTNKETIIKRFKFINENKITQQ